jgi:hypothetical protein
MSDSLVLTVAFEASSEKFILALRNISTNRLRVEVQPTNFQGCIVVSGKEGGPKRYYEKRYRMMRATSEWSDSQQEMQPGAEVIWRLPIAEMRDIHDNRLTLRELNGASVSAELHQVATVPSDGNYILNNASQKSAKLDIKVDGAANRSQPVSSETNRTSAAAGSGR